MKSQQEIHLENWVSNHKISQMDIATDEVREQEKLERQMDKIGYYIIYVVVFCLATIGLLALFGHHRWPGI